MGSYALGYFAPPVAPGQGLEVEPAEAQLSGHMTNWGEALYAKLATRAGLEKSDKLRHAARRAPVSPQSTPATGRR